MVAATTGGTMNVGIRRRLTAPLAAIGVVIAMSVAGPLAPAHAANVVHAVPAAPTGAQTMAFHAKAPAASGKVSTLAHPLDITCYFQVDPPVVRGGRTDSGVFADAEVFCLFDIDGSAANVPSIDLT